MYIFIVAEGLGYYNRVRNMQKAAVIVTEQYGGIFPSSVEELQKLPGIGSYTAGAVASIAYGRPAAAVDGNVLRVTKRLAGSFDDITKPAVKKEMEQMIEIVSQKASKRGIYPGDLSQALMELGAMVCLPVGKPLCEKCPVCHLCQVFLYQTLPEGQKPQKETEVNRELWREIPVKPAKKKRRMEDRTVFVLKLPKKEEGSELSEDRIAIQKRPERGLLAGLWELPSVSGRLTQQEARTYLEEVLGLQVVSCQPLGDAKHIFSHVEWKMTGYEVRLAGGTLSGQLRFVTQKELETEYSLPAAFEAYRTE